LRYAQAWADRPQLVQNDLRLTAADLVAAARRQAAKLVNAGLAPGDHVLILAWNSPGWVIAFWAILWAGGVPALGNPWWSEAEVGDAVRLVRPRFVLADA